MMSRVNPPPPNASIVICVYTEKRWDDICAAVNSCEIQRLPAREILIVVDHNSPLAVRLASNFPNHLVFENEERRGLSGARNTALHRVSTDIVAFLDDDAQAPDDWLAGIHALFADDDVAAVGGAADPQWPEGEAPRWFPMEFGWIVGCSFVGQPERRAEIRNLMGCNMAFRRAMLEMVGGFAEGIGRVGSLPLGCEETELCIRLKRNFPASRILYDPSLRVRHRVTSERSTLEYFCRRCWSEGLSKAIVAKLAGSAQGLASERRYVSAVLPMGLFRGARDALRGELGGLARCAAILLGLSITTLGYLWGRISFRRRTEVR